MSSTQAATGPRHFHDELDTLKQRLLEMSGKAESIVDLSIEALVQMSAA